MKTYRINGGWWQFIAPLRKREAFRTSGSMLGEVTPDGAGSMGELPREWRRLAQAADYVVYSYETPIAWHIPGHDDKGEWIMPDVRYSVTTCKQQSRIRVALSVLWDAAYDQYAS